MVCLCLFIFVFQLCAKRSYFLQNWVLQSLIKVLFSFLKKRGHPDYVSNTVIAQFVLSNRVLMRGGGGRGRGADLGGPQFLF